MKEKLIFAAVALAMAVSCKPLPSQSYEKYYLTGPVKSMSVSAYKGEYSYNTTFGPRGVISKIEHFNTDGTLRFTEYNTYNRRNRMVKNLVINGNGVSEGIYTYEYDGRFISVSRAFGMNSDEIYKWENTNDGKHIVRSVFFIEGSPDAITYSEYDGLVCNQRTVSAAGGEEIGSGVMTFYAKDKVASVKTETMDFRIEYDGKGLPIHTWNTCLDSSGDVYYEPSLETYPDRYYKYEFDRKGNWTERTEHFHPDSTAIGVVERSIVY